MAKSKKNQKFLYGGFSEYPGSFQTKNELLQREAHYIRTLRCVNKVVLGRTTKEYHGDKKDKIKQYREDSKEYKK